MKSAPNLFIPAFGKCGTTTTGILLGNHHQISLPKIGDLPWENKYIKEPAFFFDSPKKRLPFCEEAYRKNAKYRLDGTPYYYANNKILSAIKNYSENPKFIVLMRDPVERALSLWNHFKQYLVEIQPKEDVWGMHNDFTFDQQIEFELENGILGLFRGSLYVNDVKNMLSLFPRENIHFAFMEDLGEDHQLFFDNIFYFLDLPLHKIEPKSFNVRDYCFTPTKEEIEKLRFVFYQQTEELERTIRQHVPDSWGEKTKYE